IARVARARGIRLILDAMSSFGGIPLDMAELGVDFLISSANKCIQGVPGFGFVIARTDALASCSGHARSLSLDLFDQWQTMEKDPGKWRFTSPTHGVRAFAQALEELAAEGGIPKRHRRYSRNQHILREGMVELGFTPLLPPDRQSPIITAFLYPDHPGFNFDTFYHALKSQGFVIYPGKVTERDTFRMGNIGDVYPRDMERLIQTVSRSIPWSGT
ncbi:MAG: 2-aminoethylphosphonate--pyruvate transaminase, partial [Desulfobacterales bacterium]|nr:2-aminoethylphosphonate--pyruvate transaminase [Desulfobacterales bacterium]